MKDDRTYKLGQLAELKDKIRSMAVLIHSHIQSLKDEFEPRTVDLSYLKDVDPEHVRVYATDVAKELKKYKSLLEEMKALKRELGVEEDD